ncbi:DUF4189 domain-containing protein [Hydrogenophaga sp.]|uniref:DUF4189 domain-containing protein n=1 Tax=Hydrogenophaga sp. TaxID=1904254 RepID=UPI0027328F76|nr:DUF4189 domain-containing protein [Hydrogenophaga sp.]MDP1572732.1 DUF4189 domain-containing protein [Pseudomonadota bacterium]MDP1904898.1 DUF4189 domain-containing protein [Pseudomonadota bacterium]MDP3325649.1 DUF4189 domain-containing protein [Hydrogenophaga sp.]MDP3887571.1 DUF4189 domain-containing protein [Hydrogenophaga sp.]
MKKYCFLFFIFILHSSYSFAEGAMAKDKTTGKLGISVNEINEQEANNKALKFCNSNSCEIVSNFKTGCAAWAAGNGYAAGSYGASTVDEASTAALQECSKNTNNCQVVLRGCEKTGQGQPTQVQLIQAPTAEQSKNLSLVAPQSEAGNKKNTLSNVDAEFENNKLHIFLFDTRSVGGKCQLHFKLINKTPFNLTKNSLTGQIKGGNMGNIAFPADGFELSVGSIIDFQSLPSGSTAESYVTLNWANECTNESLSTYFVTRLGFHNPGAIVQDGISTSDFIRAFSIINGFKFRLSGGLDEASRLTDPQYRVRKGKIQACYSSCESALVQCANKYKSAANQICGIPNASCLRSCDAIK